MRINPALAASKNEIPILLSAVRAGSKMSLLELCTELSPLLSSSTPVNLRQQWLRWTAGTPRLRLVAGAGARETKPQQVPTLQALAQIHKEAVERRWISGTVPGTERLCEFLVEEPERRGAALAKRIQRRRARSVNEFVDRLVQDYLLEKNDAKLCQTLPTGAGEALGWALVESLRKRLVFEKPRSSSTRALKKAKAYNAVGEEDAYSKSITMLTSIAKNFRLELTAFSEQLRHQKVVGAAEIEQEVREHNEMIAAAEADDAGAAGQVPGGDEDNEPRVPGLFKKTSEHVGIPTSSKIGALGNGRRT